MKLDSGSAIIQKKIFIKNNDNETLKFKTQKLEYNAFPEANKSF